MVYPRGQRRVHLDTERTRHCVEVSTTRHIPLMITFLDDSTLQMKALVSSEPEARCRESEVQHRDVIRLL